MATDLLRERLPPGCHFGVTQDGRVFFVDDRQQTTSWLHPVTGQPVLTGLQSSKDLPQGWEQDTTNEGQVFFVDHNRELTTFDHPVYGRPLETQPPPAQPHLSTTDSVSSPPQSPAVPQSPDSQTSKENFKRGTPKQRSVKAPSAKRNPDSEVVKRGWLHRLESSGLSKSKAWKRRWCVLADFALFIYKSEDEAVTLSSILLPSYRINPCTEADKIQRNFVFKVEHENTKTLYFATDDTPECMSWMSLLRQAAMMNGNVGFQREPNNNMRQHPLKTMNKSPMLDRQPSDPMGSTPYPGQPHHRDSSGQNWGPPSTTGGQPYPADAGHPHSGQAYPRGGPGPSQYPDGRHPSSGSDPRHSYSSQSPSYKGYGDPAASPLATPTDRNFPRGFGNPAYGSVGHPQQRQNPPSHDGSNRNSLANASNRGSQAYSSSGRDHPFNPNQSQGSGSFHGSGGRASDSRPVSNTYPQNHPLSQQHLRDGFAPDSARNSLAQSDSSRNGPHSYNPGQAERQRLQQHLGHAPPGSAAEMDQRRSDPQRDSFSDYNDDSHPRQLHRWDQNFPNLESDNVKHGSYDDLLDGGRGRGRPTDREKTFNVRSKSHENFSRFPEKQQQQQQQQQQQHPYQQQHNQPQQHHRQGSFGQPAARNSSHQPQPADNGRQQGQPYPAPRMSNPMSGGPHLSPGSSQGSPSQHSSQRGSQQGYQPHPSPHVMPRNHHGDPRDPRHQPQQQPALHQDRRSYASTSSAGGPNSSFRDPGNRSFSSNQNLPPGPQQQQHVYPQQQQQQQQQQPQQYDPRHPHSSQQRLSQDRPDSMSKLNSAAPGMHNNPHIYVNFPNRTPQSQQAHNDSRGSSNDQSPGRPPYPVAVRQKLVEEMAEARTPVTHNDFITSAQLNQQRMQQPSYFQYPSPRDQQISRQSLERSSDSLRHPPPQQQSPSHARNLPNSRLSSASRTSQSSRGDQKDSSHSPQDSFSRTNMMDPEAQKLRMAYERVHSLRMAPDKAPPKRKPAPIQTVKEDPNMSDRDILETNLQKISKKNPLSGPRLRMSISAGDLIGKTHDELVLLLIQLRRNQAALEKTRDFYRTQIEQRKPAEMEYKKLMHQYGEVHDRLLHDQHQSFMEARTQMEEIDNKLEVYKPIINLLDNMVTMGSLYGGDNLMLATQYRKHLLRPDQYQPPKKMLEFSRRHQEDRLIQETEEEIKQLSSAEVDLEDKIDRLNELDRLLQQQSFTVSSFREDKELMEKALVGVLRQQDQYNNDPREMRRLTQQQRTLEKEISRVTQQLAEASKELEETTAENNKLEHEVALLRTKVHGELTRSRSAPSLASESVRNKMKMEKEVAKVEGIMQGLSKEGARLSEAMNNIRRSSSSGNLASLEKEERKKGGTYLQTDLDSGDQVDLANAWERSPTEGDNSRPIINHQRQNANTSEDWDMDGADDNTKRFFGLQPKDKPKGLTVRDVKRQAEQRKERDKNRRDGDDYGNGEEIKLRVSNVDTEASSIIHARIPSDPSGHNPSSNQWETGHPLYENLSRYGSASAQPETQSAPGSRRSSLILMAPKPFTPYQDRSGRPFRSELALNASGDPLFDARNNGQVLNMNTGDTGRMYRSAEILNDFPHSSQLSNNNKGEGDPYVNQSMLGTSGPNHYPTNSFDSQPQLASGQFYATPYSSLQGSHGDISQGNGINDQHLVPSQSNTSHLQSAPANTWRQKTDDPPESAEHIARPINTEALQSSRAYTARPWAKQGAELDNNIFNVKRNPRGRYLTISSSEPLKLETNALLNPTLHSAAGDLILNRTIDDVPDIVKSSQTKVDQIDEDTIEREILYVPEKVLIPERYDPEADAEHLTEEDRRRRQEKAEKIKKVLTSQSVLSMSQPDVSQLGESDVHNRVQQEKKERAHFLTLNQELARQVTLQSKKQAAERRKTWSGAQFADAKRQYEEGLLGSPTSPIRSPDAVRKRAEITLRQL